MLTCSHRHHTHGHILHTHSHSYTDRVTCIPTIILINTLEHPLTCSNIIAKIVSLDIYIYSLILRSQQWNQVQFHQLSLWENKDFIRLTYITMGEVLYGQEHGWVKSSHTGKSVSCEHVWWLSCGCVVGFPSLSPAPSVQLSTSLRPCTVREDCIQLVERSGWILGLGFHDPPWHSFYKDEQAQLWWSFISRHSWYDKDSGILAWRIVLYHQHILTTVYGCSHLGIRRCMLMLSMDWLPPS